MFKGKNIAQRNAHITIKGFKNCNLFENKTKKEICKIEDFVLSYQGEYLAIVITRVEKSQYGSIFEYRVDVIDINSHSEIYTGEWLGSFQQHYIFCQFSFCSKYLIDHSNQTLNLRNIYGKQIVRIQNIQQVYMLDQQNQIYLLKENKIWIYSININTFRVIIIGESGLTQLLMISSQVFLGAKNILQMFFRCELKRKQLYFLKNKYIFGRQDKIYGIQNILLVIYCKCQLQLRNMKNFKLMRNIFLGIQNRQNFIKFNDDYNLSQTISYFPQGTLVCQQFNLLTGKATQLSFKLNINSYEEIYITNSLLVNIYENHKKIRYFSFDCY